MTLDATVAEELTPTMYSYLNLDGGKTAYIIGNGQSRIGLDLDVLGRIYGVVMHCLETILQTTLQ